MNGKVNNVPAEDWEKVTEIINKTRHSITIPENDLDFLFKMYNKYFTSDNLKTDCPGCVMTVVSRLRYLVPNTHI